MAGWRTGPDTVQWEVMHQLAVTGQPAPDIAVLLGDEQLQIHRIERDEARITRLIALERGFWDYVTLTTCRRQPTGRSRLSSHCAACIRTIMAPALISRRMLANRPHSLN